MEKRQITPELMTQFFCNEDKSLNEMIRKVIHDDEESRKEFDNYLEVWEKSAVAKEFEAVDTESDWRLVRSRMKGMGRVKRISASTYFLRIAAILILALGLTYFLAQLIQTTGKVNTEYFEIAAHEKGRKVDLPDGSIITLNKHSKIISNSNFGNTNRDIILEGEAFFEVAGNENLPFRVYSRNSTVQVLGTSFNINTLEKQVIVGVVTGHVQFFETGNKKNGVDLFRDNTGIFETETHQFSKASSIDLNSIDWRYNAPGIVRVPASIIFRTLAEKYHKQLDMKDEFNEPISFRIEPSKSLDEQILTLNQLGNQIFEIEKDGNRLVVRKH